MAQASAAGRRWPTARAAPSAGPADRRADRDAAMRRLLRGAGRPSTTTGTCAAAATSAAPIHDAAWNAELDAARRWLDALPIRGEIVELAAGTGWWSPLLAQKGELSLYDAAEAPLDRARDRLVAHGLRAHIHVRDAWAEPDRQVDALFAGFWLSHVPRARLADVPRARPSLAQAGRPVRLHRLAAATRSRPRADHPTPADDVSAARLDDGREFTIVKVYYEPAELEAALPRPASRPPTSRRRPVLRDGSATA